MMLSNDFLSAIGYQKGQKIAVAVSGGSDSLALLFMACEKLGSQNVIAITFNHKLRKEAYDEALFVKKQCQKLKCEHILLEADDAHPIKASQNKARIARYQHILAYCHGHHIPYLFLAHHKNDQAETYYIRLYQQSHLWGLAAMPISYKQGHVCVVRPFIDESSYKLKNYLKEKNMEWIEDPSNQNDKYLRVKIREAFKENKLKQPNIKAIQSYRQNMLSLMEKWLTCHSQIKGAGLLMIDKQAFMELPKELSLHILKLTIQAIGYRSYGLSLKEIDEKYQDILSPLLFSIGHCLIFSDSQYLYIQHEYRAHRQRKSCAMEKGYILYDKRFHIFYPKEAEIEVSYVGDYKKTCLPHLQQLIDISHKKRYRFVKALPLVKYDENRYIYPDIQSGKWGENSIYIDDDNQLKKMLCQKYFIAPYF